MTGRVEDGPLGVQPTGDGIDVAVLAPDAEAVAICLFDAADRETHRLRLPDRVGGVWHGHFPGVAAGARYGLRAHGPWDPAAGHRFNPNKLLLDPWALTLDRPLRLHPALFDADAPRADDTAPLMPKGIVLCPDAAAGAGAPDWDRQVIYELHVRGFTMTHPDIPPAIRGTYAALAHPAATGHLRRLGVTAVEIMPSAAWVDERHLPAIGRSNYWGYNPVGFLAPDPRLAPGGWADVRAATDALHAAGMHVILDVVLNHSGESDELGPTLSLRGLGNAAYYRLQPGRRALYANDAGCGNTLAMDRLPALRLGLDALRAWVLHGGFDGFRLDLAATLARRDGGFDPDAPFLLATEQDPLLAGRVMIAEPWDIGAGGYRLGAFPARWGEWNDRYRDDVRRFWRGDAGSLGAFTTRFAGSADVFPPHRPLTRSINYVTAHDGFTLADLVAYTARHNEANGEHNRDGTADNLSWNNGAEGPTEDAAICEARGRDVRALLATLLLSRGTPMLSMGDELGRTQRGNNNAYAQDNATSWIDWPGADRNLIAFTASLIALRRRLAPLFTGRPLTGRAQAGGLPDVAWLRPDGAPMGTDDWNRPDGHTLVAVLAAGDTRAALAFHAGHSPLTLVLPDARPGFAWQRLPPDAEGEAIPPRSVGVFEEVRSPARATRGGGVSDEQLDGLARQAGIDPAWWDIGGGRHAVSPETKRALLAAMHLPAATRGDFMASRARLNSAPPLPSVVTGRVGRMLALPVGQPAPRWATLLREDGTTERWPVDGDTLSMPPLPAGRHRLLPEDRWENPCHVIVAPEGCFLPAVLRGGEHRFGIAAQLYALRSRDDQGIGDFTTLRHLVAEAARAGAAMIGLNPLHALFPHDRQQTSPYHPSDRRFLDPIYIDVSGLPGGAAAPVPGPVDHAAVWRHKREVLRQAVRPVQAMADGLRQFATFEAIADALGSSHWQAWPEELRHPDAPGVARFAGRHADEVAFHAFAQTLAEQQLAEAAEAARREGVSLGFYRDLAVGAAPEGAEAWAVQDTLMFAVSVGAPPDPFSATGQVWCLPPPNPAAMRRDGYAAFDALLAANMRHAGALRIDHVMGLRRLFVIPDGATAADGAYLTYPVDDLLAVTALRSQRARCLVVGEDLGTVPEGMAEALAANDILSYSVLWFERRDGRFRPAAEWRHLAAACVSTHDLPTLAGWWSGADIDEKQAIGLLSEAAAAGARAERVRDRTELVELLQDAALLDEEADPLQPITDPIAAAVHAFVSGTPALLALVQADDLAGETVAVNLPGTDRERPNWRRRLGTDVADLLHAPLAQAILRAVAARRNRDGVDLPAGDP